jgi:hypothetical protein
VAVVDLLVVAQGRSHDVVGLVLLPVAGLVVEQVLDAGLLVREGVEAARNRMTAKARTPVLSKATPAGTLSAMTRRFWYWHYSDVPGCPLHVGY